MHPADIKSAIEKAGSSQAAIARALEKSDVAVNHVIYGRSSSRAVAEHIARLTGLSLDELWPGRYPQDDSKEVRKLTTRPRRDHAHRRRAAADQAV